MQGRTQTLLSVQSIRDKTTLRVNNGLNSKKREQTFLQTFQTFRLFIVETRMRDDG